MAYDDEIDSQRITNGMRERVEAIQYDAGNLAVLLDLIRDQVWDIKKQIQSGITRFADGDFHAAFALIDVTTREIERIKLVSEDFTTFKIEEQAGKAVANG